MQELEPGLKEVVMKVALAGTEDHSTLDSLLPLLDIPQVFLSEPSLSLPDLSVIWNSELRYYRVKMSAMVHRSVNECCGSIRGDGRM